jgi:hypothetical protein
MTDIGDDKARVIAFPGGYLLVPLPKRPSDREFPDSAVAPKQNPP